MQALPDSVQIIADVIGVDAALHLVNLLPRKYRPQNPNGEAILYVPKAKTLRPDHRLVEILGYPDAMKLVCAFGGETLYPAAICKQVTSVDRNNAIQELTAKGKTPTEIATMLQMSERQVKRIAEKRAA